MKTKTLHTLFQTTFTRFAAALVVVAGLVCAQAQNTYIWAPGGIQDADGTWDTTTANWLPGPVAWPNKTDPGDKAQFGLVTTNRYVTLSGTINADSLVFTNLGTGWGTDWTFTGGTLNLVGNATIDTWTNQNAVRIESLITGENGLTLTNSSIYVRHQNAELRLVNDNTFTGLSKISYSTVALYRTNAMGPSGDGNEVDLYAKGRLLIAGLNGGSTPISVSKNVRLKSNVDYASTAAIRSSNAHNTFNGDIVNYVLDAGINVNTPHTFTLNGTINSGIGLHGNPRLILSASGGASSKLVVNSTISYASDDIPTRLLIDGSGSNPANNGTVELTASNTFRGDITIRRGTLLMSNEDAVGAESGASIFLGDGGLGNSGNTLAFLINGPYKMGRYVAFNQAAGANTYIGVIGGSTAHTSEFTAPISINDNNASTYCVTAAAGGTVYIKSWIKDYGRNKVLNKIGPGTVILNDPSNVIGGGVDVKEGTLLANNGYGGSSTSTNVVTVRSNATFGGFGCRIFGPVVYQNDAKAWFNLTPIDTGESNSTYMVISNTVTFNSGNVVRVNIAGTNPVGAGTYTLAISETAIVTNGPLSAVIESGPVAAGINVTNVFVDQTGTKLLLVLDTAAVPPTPPVLSNATISGGKMVITFSGPSGQTYQVLTSTNVAAPMAQWTPVSSGTFGTNAVIFTNGTLTDPQRFYRIGSP